MEPRRLPEEILKRIGFVKSTNTVRDSFMRDLVFYQRGTIYLTNYDVLIGDDFGDPDLSKKGLWLVWAKKWGRIKYFKVSEELIISATDYFIVELEKFEKELDKE